MSAIDISVVIPLYNKPDTINRAIASVLDQQGVALEVIVVDDGSSDDSPDRITADHLARISLIRQANAGPGAARNRGAAASMGRILAFLDADDEWLPGFAETAVAMLDAHPECAAYAAAYVTGDGSVQKELLLDVAAESGPRDIAAEEGPVDTKRFLDSLHSSASAVRRETFEAFGGFYDKDRCTYGEDSWLWLQVAFSGPIYLDREKRSVFHVEASDLGAALTNAHPRRPALIDPEILRRQCPLERVRQLDELLAYYRLIETEQMVSQHQGGDVEELRSRFPWPSIPTPLLLAREMRVRAMAMAMPRR